MTYTCFAVDLAGNQIGESEQCNTDQEVQAFAKRELEGPLAARVTVYEDPHDVYSGGYLGTFTGHWRTAPQWDTNRKPGERYLDLTFTAEAK